METLSQYVNRVGTINAKSHYTSEIKSKLEAIKQIRSLYTEGESLEQEDLDRISHIESIITGYQQTLEQIDSMPFVQEPAVIQPHQEI